VLEEFTLAAQSAVPCDNHHAAPCLACQHAFPLQPIATGHNNLAIGARVQQVSKHFIDGTKLNEGMLNHVSSVVRAYDPCLSCSTHAFGQPALQIRLVDPRGQILDQISTD
jgi:hypothetical protein